LFSWIFLENRDEAVAVTRQNNWTTAFSITFVLAIRLVTAFDPAGIKSPLNRRTFLRSTLLASAAVRSGIPLQAQEAPPSAPAGEKFILGAPLTHSDWMLKPGISWGEAGVRHMLDACKACGWNKVYWRVFDGGRSCYRSQLLRPAGKWDADNFWAPQTPEDRAILQRYTAHMKPEQRTALLAKFDTLDYSTFDTLDAAIRYGHEIGLQIHAWLSINEDDHGWGMQSEFAKRHPEFRWRKRNGNSYRSQLSFAFPEVRAYKLALIQEILAYNIDGLFLDWIRTGDVRDNPQTDAEGIADSGYERPLVDAFKARYGEDSVQIPNGDDRWVRIRAEPQTEFMRAASQLIRRHRASLPIAALVGHPWHYRGEINKIDGNLRGLLLDVAAWAREGLVDAVIPAGYYRDGSNAELAWEALRKETSGKVDVWTYAWVPKTIAEAEQTFATATKLGAKEILYWEADYIDDRANAPELKSFMRQRAVNVPG
jgi:hypothetical protein